jgi:hypothetical protein
MLIAALAAGCEERLAPSRGIETRVYVDRTEARVGDPVGVTVEIETPERFTVESPASPPADAQFFTERVERLEPIGIAGGVRHRVLWSLRARTVGDHALPKLSIPLVWPDGRIQRLAVGGIPLPVRSVRTELPDRDIYFDIQPPPSPPERRGWGWLVAGGSIVAAGVGLLLYRRRTIDRTEASPGPGPLARQTLAGIDAALTENDLRASAVRLITLLGTFVRRRWGIEGNTWTPEELPPEVDAPVAAALREFEAARFTSVPQRQQVLDAVAPLRTYLADVSRNR